MDEKQLKAFAESRPQLENAKQFSQQFLTAHGKKQNEIAAYLSKLDTLAIPQSLPNDVELIDDPDRFRRRATPGRYAVPAQEYSDLFPAKL